MTVVRRMAPAALRGSVVTVPTDRRSDRRIIDHESAGDADPAELTSIESRKP
ncbi:MAG: hypothetical protein ACRCXL_11315 [Dermatophilaceae bacterium]